MIKKKKDVNRECLSLVVRLSILYVMKIFSISLTLAAMASGIGMAHASVPSVLLDSLPEKWELEATYFQTTPSEDRWWQSFNDPILTALINRAVENNYNVLAAQQRIEAARQVSRETRAGYFPTLGVRAGWSGERNSGDIQAAHGHSETMSYFNLGLTMNWEIDVFGRIRAQLKADKADYEASIADYDATLVSLCSNLAKAYFQLRMAQAEVEVAERNIKNAEELLKIASTRYEVGLAPSVDQVQARMVVTETRATLPTLKADISTALNEIALLVGEYPDKLAELRESFPLPATPPPGYVASPEALLRRRPDVVAAEKQLAAAAAQVGIAKKDFLPTLSVSAGIGTEARNLKDVFGSGSLYYTVMPTLSWTIFDGLARNARVAEAKATMMSEIDEYNLTVMTAVQEVNNAMVSWQSATDQLVYQQMLLKDARRVLELQLDRYKQGLNAFSDVATAQTTVLQYENSVVSSHASCLAALVTLYTALGGGWGDVGL